MKLGIIGSGKIGKSIGSWAAAAGYDVIFSSRNFQHAQEAARIAGKNSKSGTVPDAVEASDMVLLAVPYRAVNEVLADIGPQLRDKVLIDVTNALNSDYSGLTVGFTTSAAEEIQKLAPGAKVVKAFNTIFARVFETQNPKIKGNTISILYASDDKEAKIKVADLIMRLGFDPVDAGGLKAARNLEPMGLLNINLGFGMGHGTQIGFSFLR